MGMFNFAANWRAIFTIQGDVEDTSTKLLRHLSLQLQAFAHPHFNTAVMVTDGQDHACRL
jgi:hypothetical protein